MSQIKTISQTGARWSFIATLLLAGCRCVEPPKNISLAHREVMHYYESGCFAEELRTIVQHTKRQFTQPTADPKEIIIFDVDFTALNYYEHMKSIQFGYVANLFHQWIMAADAPAMPSMLALYTHFKELGYTIFFITERQPDEFEATQENLKRAGFEGYERLIIRSEEQCAIPYITYKGCIRAGLVAQGYKIIASASDQEQDFIGDNIGFPIRIPNYLFSLAYILENPS